MNIGYARVSTTDQNLDLQKIALQQHGCTTIYEDHGVSGAVKDRPGLTAALSALKKGDTLVIWRLDRLGRSLSNLIELVAELEKRGIGLKSSQESIDTSTSGGRLIFHVFGALAEFERQLIRERTKAGIEAERKRRGYLRRAPKKLSLEEECELRAMYHHDHKVSTIMQKFGISKQSVYNYLHQGC